MAVTKKNIVFWSIKIQFGPHKGLLRLRYRAQPVNAKYDLRFSRR
jgi:hypothetical protein